MAIVNHVLAVSVWLASCLALAIVSDPAYGFLFFVPFTLGPHAVSHGLCFVLNSRGAAVALCIGMLAYLAWFFYVYADAFYFNVDAQSGIALAFIGIFSLPVMVPVWLGAWALERAAIKKAAVRPTLEGRAGDDQRGGGV